MPGFLYHLACAKIVADKKYAKVATDYDRFLMGSLIPGVCKNWGDCDEELLALLRRERDALELGVYLHLYAEKNLGYDVGLSDEEIGLDLIAAKLVPVDKVFRLPKELPMTGIPRFDERNEVSWRDEIRQVLMNPPPVSGNIKTARKCIFKTAKRFMVEVYGGSGVAGDSGDLSDSSVSDSGDSSDSSDSSDFSTGE